MDQRLPRPNAEIAFADVGGEGPAVVFVHGAGMDQSMFDTQVEALTAGGHRVVTWDLRGARGIDPRAGGAVAAADALDDLTALLRECEIDRAVLVGHSLGGNLAQAFVRTHAMRAAGLIVLDSTWNTGPLSGFALRLASPSLAMIPARTPRLMAKASAVTPSAIARTEATFARKAKRGFLDVWRATVSFVEPDPDYRCLVPLALVRGIAPGTSRRRCRAGRRRKGSPSTSSRTRAISSPTTHPRRPRKHCCASSIRGPRESGARTRK